VASIVNITPEQAKLKAIEEAKVEAMRLAGVNEWIQSFNYLETKEGGGNYEEFFHSLTSVQTLGSVTGWEVVEERKKIDEFNNLIYEVSINATVQLYKTRKDPEFQILLSGIDKIYKNEANLTFDILAKKEGYLKIFVIDGKREVSLLFPNEHEKSFLIPRDQKLTFPQSSHFKYEIYTDLEEESNHLFFLFTRKDILYKAENFQQFIEYVYSIEPEDRFVSVEKIAIYK
jgi:hypothetical protein